MEDALLHMLSVMTCPNCIYVDASNKLKLRCRRLAAGVVGESARCVQDYDWCGEGEWAVISATLRPHVQEASVGLVTRSSIYSLSPFELRSLQLLNPYHLDHKDHK